MNFDIKNKLGILKITEMGFITIDYTINDDIILYKSVKITVGEETIEFNSGDFVKDWFNSKKFFILNMGNDFHLSCSSTVNHFIMDGAKFDSAYLHIENGKPILKYPDKSKENWFLDPIFDGMEIFVNEGTTPTWDELKDYCKDE